MNRADAALSFPLTRLIAEGPAEELGLTVNTQPVMLASSVAFLEAWRAAGGPEPEVLAGHSSGEYPRSPPPGSSRSKTPSGSGPIPRRSHAERRARGRGRHGRHYWI